MKFTIFCVNQGLFVKINDFDLENLVVTTIDFGFFLKMLLFLSIHTVQSNSAIALNLMTFLLLL